MTDVDAQRPFKKRRFLAHEPPPERAASPPDRAATATAATGDASSAFAESFREISGEASLDAQTLTALERASGGDVAQALNSWFDGSWKKCQDLIKHADVASANGTTGLPVEAASQLRKLETIESPGLKSSASPRPRHSPGPTSSADQKPSKAASWSRKFIGAFGTTGFLTNSLARLVAGQKLAVSRQNLEPKSKASKSVGGKGATKQTTFRPFPNKDAKKPANYLTRFCLLDGTEIGRLPQDSAMVVSTLIDQDICAFEVECIFAPERSRVGANVDLMVSCYLKRSAFTHKSTPSTNNELVDDAAESAEERMLKLRRFALVKLFELINLNAVGRSESWQSVASMAETSLDQKPVKKSDDEDDESEDGAELAQDQLDSLYRKAQTFDQNMPGLDPADTFAFTLKPYQRQALHWMVNKEREDENAARQTESMHPLWEQFALPREQGAAEDAPAEHFYMNPYSGEMSLHFPKALDQCHGGILADEMGLGKTIEILSLVHTAKLERDAAEQSFMSTQAARSAGNTQCHTTLVVAPLSLIQQWQSEAESSAKEGTLKTLLYYSDSKVDVQQLCAGPNARYAPDLIITSYGVVLSEWQQCQQTGRQTGLFGVDFFRVVLDEAHTIKNRQAKTSRACFSLSATRRWALTGTPIVNKLEDLFSLVHYLGVEPWGHFSFWRTFITIPFESKEYIRALDVVQTVLEPLVLRRTKDMKDVDGQPIVQLPEKRVEKVYLELSERERDIYDFISARARRTFQQNAAQGTVMKNYSTILSMLLRLRQSCCDPSLVKQGATQAELALDDGNPDAAGDGADELVEDVNLKDMIEQYAETTSGGGGDDAATGEEKKAGSAYGAAVLQQILHDSEQECPICAEEPIRQQTVTKCFHTACRECLVGHLAFQRKKGEEQPLCHICREPVHENDLLEVIRTPGDNSNSADGGDGNEASSGDDVILRPVNRRQMGSTKVSALHDHLESTRRSDPSIKSVVFSQFTGFLDILERSLKLRKVPLQRLDGSMSMRERASQLDAFRSVTRPGAVLLISLKAGGVGLNLTCASHVYMLDPWWSAAIENQAIDRVHRMGQEKAVQVFRFLIRDSVEEKMLKVQDRKNFLASSLGMSKEERKRETLRDIETLFED